MEPLNTRTLTKAIEFAAEHNNTSIGIIMNTRLDAVSLHQQILNEYRNLCGTRNCEIRFSNGSYIRVHSISDAGADNTRGRRYNIILISASIDYDDSLVVFGRMENPEHGHPGFFYRYDNRTQSYYEDPFVIDDIVDMFNSVQTGSGYTMNSVEFFNAWQSMDEYEFSIVDGRIDIKKKEAPDLGEFSPSQELNNFVNTLIQGE